MVEHRLKETEKGIFQNARGDDVVVPSGPFRKDTQPGLNGFGLINRLHLQIEK